MNANAEVIHFEGTCDVCGAPLVYDYDPLTSMIDSDVDSEGRMITWIRHYATAPRGANPDCAIYSSTVTETKGDLGQ